MFHLSVYNTLHGWIGDHFGCKWEDTLEQRIKKKRMKKQRQCDGERKNGEWQNNTNTNNSSRMTTSTATAKCSKNKILLLYWRKKKEIQKKIHQKLYIWSIWHSHRLLNATIRIGGSVMICESQSHKRFVNDSTLLFN